MQPIKNFYLQKFKEKVAFFSNCIFQKLNFAKIERQLEMQHIKHFYFYEKEIRKKKKEGQSQEEPQSQPTQRNKQPASESGNQSEDEEAQWRSRGAHRPVRIFIGQIVTFFSNS